MAARKIREYLISFKRADDEHDEIVERTFRAENPDQAKQMLEAEADLETVEIIIVDCKAVRGTVQEVAEDAEGKRSNIVQKMMDQATEIGDEDDSDATPHPPEDFAAYVETGPEKLTKKQWEILRDCVNLDENDTDNAKRLLKWFGDELMHIQENGWHGWCGTHWDGEHGQHAVEKRAQMVVARIKREAALIDNDPSAAEIIAEAEKLLGEVEGNVRSLSAMGKEVIAEAEAIKKALAKKRSARYQFGVRSGDRSRTMAMIGQAEPHRSVLPAVLDQEDDALNCLNGTVRVNMCEHTHDKDGNAYKEPKFEAEAFLDKHNPDDLFTKVCAAAYDPSAEAPKFVGDLERFMPDKAMREFLQVAMGYVVFGWTGEQVYLFFYGDGANWKSAFLQAIARTVGTYYKPMNYTSVSGNNMPTGDKPSPDWARLSGVRMLTIEEVPRKEPIKEELVKLVTSGTPLPVRHLNKGMFDLIAKFTCIMTSNAEPSISGHDKGIWRRTMIVPWDVTIPEAERLPFDMVMAGYDAERSGILNWLIQGACKYKENGLQPYVTQRMRDFTDSVRADRDAAGSFIEDCVEHAEGEHVTAGDLYKAFYTYCKANGIDPILNSTAFGRQVKRNDVNGTTMERRKHKVQGVRRFNDIRLHDVPDLGVDGYEEMRR